MNCLSWLFTAGSFIIPGRVSSPVIFLVPPEKLVLEVSASGGYRGIVWSRDGNLLGTVAAPAVISEITHFFEIFVREPTTTSDLGVYEVVYSGAGGVGTYIIVTSQGMQLYCRILVVMIIVHFHLRLLFMLSIFLKFFIEVHFSGFVPGVGGGGGGSRVWEGYSHSIV